MSAGARTRRTGETARERPRRAAVAATADEAAAGPDDAEGRGSGGIRSIGRAFALLEEIARHRDGIGLADLSKRVGLHNSTAFHLVKTLTALGYVRQMAETKRYRIGRPIFALAASALDEREMVSLSSPVLEDLARETGEGSHLAVGMNDQVVVIARISGPGAFQLTDRVGVIRPAWCTALGKVILAALPPSRLERYLETVELSPLTPKTITDPDLLRREIETVRETGIAYDDGEFDEEVRCVAMPVRDFRGDVAGAIGISGPVWRLSLAALQGHVRLVEAAAGRLSAEFGAAGVTAA